MRILKFLEYVTFHSGAHLKVGNCPQSESSLEFFESCHDKRHFLFFQPKYGENIKLIILLIALFI